ncbi:MFS transporter [Gordonia rhizosphera]|uniref:Putative major facilitator superfamily transporter n=1 Tax=Gordonia rhizosphera NBRC 16068 TaxID=1108045 RepID=K6VWB3_9ACTN|nr:MFS transporter [Gordonia rhizosphera]GAB91200.1 putative major facilitator superfamily transporter [Gordonia rhizosphera NBRC 16068]
MRQGPLAGRYPALAVMVTFALIPFLALSAAIEPLVPTITEQLDMSAQAMSLALGLANAAYAAGTVLAVQLAQHLPQRRMLVAYAVVLVTGAVLAAGALNATMFTCGLVLLGLATSMLLIAAAPPLTIGFPKARLRQTAMIMNMCVFGAVALGPFLGGVQSAAHEWRPLFWVIVGVALLALLMAVLTFDDAPPADRDAPRDLRAIGMAATGCVLAFVGASQLASHALTDTEVLVPMLAGLALIIGLIVYQFRASRPLLTIRSVFTSSIPVAGLGVALFAAAGSVAATTLTANALMEQLSPLRVGLLYLPELGGAILMAVLFGTVITRRAMHFLPLIGMTLLAIGILVFQLALPANQPLVMLGAALTGLALGATVAPALFVVGFSLRSNSLQRVFAIIELLRAVAAFMVAPVLTHFALTVAADRSVGTGYALWIGFGLAVAGALFGVAVYAASGARPATPDLDHFLDGEEPAWFSPPLFARLRRVSAPTLGSATTSTHSVLTQPALRAPMEARSPVCFAYDGSDLADSAITRAAEYFDYGRDAVVVCVWQPADVGFTTGERHLDPNNASSVCGVAEQTAQRGADLAEKAGFRARGIAVEAAPTWRGILRAAAEHDASMIIIAPHRRTGILGHLQGSVAEAVAANASIPVLMMPSCGPSGPKPAGVDVQRQDAVIDEFVDVAVTQGAAQQNLVP